MQLDPSSQEAPKALPQSPEPYKGTGASFAFMEFDPQFELGNMDLPGFWEQRVDASLVLEYVRALSFTSEGRISGLVP